MWRLVLRRLAFALPMLLLVSFFSFVLVSLSPNDPVQAALGPQASTEQVEAERVKLGLDQPIHVQYWRWVTKAVRGDFGNAILGSGPVTQQLNTRLGVTISLVVIASLFVAVLGVGLGVLSAVRGGVIGQIVGTLSVVGLALPSFWIALMLGTWFTVKMRLFPVSGYVYLADNPWEWFRSLVLPAASVALGGMATLAKQTRNAMLEVFSKDFVRVMEANGFSRRSILYRHALRNAAIPVVTIIGVVSVGLLGGAVVIESIFGLPGLGTLAAEATNNKDLPVIQGAVVYFTLIVVAVGLIVDVSYSLLDPRIRVR